jgi:hypothetical protein
MSLQTEFDWTYFRDLVKEMSRYAMQATRGRGVLSLTRHLLRH